MAYVLQHTSALALALAYGYGLNEKRRFPALFAQALRLRDPKKMGDKTFCLQSFREPRARKLSYRRTSTVCRCEQAQSYNASLI